MKACQEAAEVTYKIYQPVWSARSDVLKTLASISSASIVLSVTFSASIKSLNVDLFWRYLILFSFSMLVLSLIRALTALWVGIGVHDVQPNMLEQREEIYKAIEKVDPSAEDLMQPFDPIFDRVNKPIEVKDKLAGRFSRASFICFGLAIVSLAVVGFRQLLP
jgi:tetrahydromethanopterin S-methyltransferase subunit B